jgi:hypothetical protein
MSLEQELARSLKVPNALGMASRLRMRAPRGLPGGSSPDWFDAIENVMRESIVPALEEQEKAILKLARAIDRLEAAQRQN